MFPFIIRILTFLLLFLPSELFSQNLITNYLFHYNFIYSLLKEITQKEYTLGSGTSVGNESLSGLGAVNERHISLSVKMLDFGSRRIGSNSGISFEVINQGNLPLEINSVSVQSLQFSLDKTNVTFPVTVVAQGSRTFRIWFKPDCVTSYIDTLTIYHNASETYNSKIILSGAGSSYTSGLGDILWEGNIPPNPNTTFQDYQPKSMKQIRDVNGDGVNDLMVATENYWTICYNGNSSVNADTLWKFNTHFGSINTGSVDWEDAMQVREDVNSDGIQDVVIGCGGGNEMVYTLSGNNGQKLWEFGNPIGTSDGDIFGLRVDKDFNNDGVKDVLVSASGEGNGTGRHAAICLNGLNGQIIFNSVQSSHFTYDIVSTQSGGAIGFGTNGGPYGIKGLNSSGVQTWTYSLTSTNWSMKTFPDINSDNHNDIIGMYGFSGGIFALSGINGNQIWAATMGSSNNGTIELLDDMNNNGFIDFTYSGPQVAYRIDSKDNTVLWSLPLSSSYIRDVDSLGDINGDNISEVLASTQQPGRVFVLNGIDGTVLFQFLFGNTISERADRVSVLLSVDSNSANEFVACSRDGRIKCFSGGPGITTGISPMNKSIPESFSLYQNYPNPFNPVTNIKFDVPENASVNLVIYDISGRLVRTLYTGELKAGVYKISWNSTGSSSGVYFCVLSSNGFREIKKMVLVK